MFNIASLSLLGLFLVYLLLSLYIFQCAFELRLNFVLLRQSSKKFSQCTMSTISIIFSRFPCSVRLYYAQPSFS